ncbi:glycosyltransferase [Paenibacillus sp. FSL K6-0276]|uniref:glycosyltransferase n=1 Tax=Paenibacillus sp. FSL K6-0276 TaxID=2921450 RepID=UPI0030ECA607
MAIFIYPPTIDWSWMKQRPQQLMKYLARAGHTVYYCNKTQEEAPPEEISPGLYLVKHHERWLKAEWPDIQKRKSAPVIVWCTLPQLSLSLQAYQSDKIIYDCVDEFPQWAPYERNMAATADAIICTSERLFRRITRQYPDKKLALIRNAYDTDMRLHLPGEPDDQQMPEDFPTVPTLGYIGAWAPWIDSKLVTRLAREQSEARVIIIGPEFGRKFLPSRAGLHFPGMKPHHQLPSYLRLLDVCLIPFLLNTVTLATNPIKAYEYLAAGKPVISTGLPECQLMQPFVDVASSPENFLKLVASRLRDPGDCEARRKFALQNTWTHRVKEIEAFVF